jgi:hypothetical protein
MTVRQMNSDISGVEKESANEIEANGLPNQRSALMLLRKASYRPLMAPLRFESFARR